MGDGPEQPPQFGPDAGHRDQQGDGGRGPWQPRVPTRRHLAVYAFLTCIVTAVFLVTWHQASRPATAGEWRTMVARDSRNMASAEAAVTGCTTVTDCRSKVHALDDQLTTFQRDLDRQPAPACLETTDQQLRVAVSDARSATRTQMADASDPAATTQYAASTEHLQQASHLLAATRC